MTKESFFYFEEIIVNEGTLLAVIRGLYCKDWDKIALV